MLEKSSTCFVWSFKLNLFCLFCFTIPTQLVLFCLKSQFFLFDFGAIDYEMDGSVFEKNDLLRCLDPSLVNWIGAVTLSLLLKAVSKKYGPLICSVKFLSQVALDLYKSTIQLCMEYWCHVWTGALNFYLHISDKQLKQVCSNAGLSLVASFELLTRCWDQLKSFL